MMVKARELNEGYNECSKCGRKPYEMMLGYDAYHIGCVYCGIQNGATQFLDETLDEQMREAVKKAWNRKYLESKIVKSAIKELGVKAGDYIITYSNDYEIIFSTSDIKAIMVFVEGSEDSYDVYCYNENALQYLGTITYSI